MNFESDLASERLRADTPAEGIELTREAYDRIELTSLTVKNEAGADAIGCPVGRYLTLAGPACFEGMVGGDMEKGISVLLASLLPQKEKRPLLVLGIGNGAVLADSVGVRSAEGVYPACGNRDNAVLIPGTEEQSGIALPLFVKGVIDTISPYAVLAVDALTTRSTERLLSTIQISDAGLLPGSGIRHTRCALTPDVLGLPVISIGLPTVISAGALIKECTEPTAQHRRPPALWLCPHDADPAIARGAAIIAGGINRFLEMF